MSNTPIPKPTILKNRKTSTQPISAEGARQNVPQRWCVPRHYHASAWERDKKEQINTGLPYPTH